MRRNIRSAAPSWCFAASSCSSNIELDWLYKEGGASSLYPDKWDEFASIIPEAERGDFIEAYRKRLTSDDPDEQLRYAKAWSKWEADTVTVLPRPEVVDHFTSPEVAVAVARIENHYMANKGWLEEGQLLRGAEKIRGIPGVIVQGRHDCCTPPRAAWATEEGLARSRPADRPRRRAFVQRAGNPRRTCPGYG